MAAKRKKESSPSVALPTRFSQLRRSRWMLLSNNDLVAKFDYGPVTTSSWCANAIDPMHQHPPNRLESSSILRMDSFSSTSLHAITSNCPIDDKSENYYFEIKILNTGDSTREEFGIQEEYGTQEFRIGISPEDPRKTEQACYGFDMYCYDSYNGSVFFARKRNPSDKCNNANKCHSNSLCSKYFACKRLSKEYGPTFTAGDVIGCGVDFKNRNCFFTKNGEHLGIAFRDIDLKSKAYWPTVCLPSYGKVLANFGNKEFRCKSPFSVSERSVILSEQFKDKFTYQADNEGKMFCDHLNDVTLISKDGKQFGCHKLILSFRSEVFKCMFEHDTSNKVHIEDVDGTTTQKLLKYIYTDDLTSEEPAVDMDLLSAANKYNLCKLKDWCEQVLISEIDKDNVIEAWMSADLLNAGNVSKACENFMIKKWKFIDTKKIEGLENTEPRKMARMMRKLFESK